MASASVRRWRESVSRTALSESQTGGVLLYAFGSLGLLTALVATARPDNPQEAADFRLLRKLDDKGQIQPGALIEAIEAAKRLRQTPPTHPDRPAAAVPPGVVAPPVTVAGLPVGPVPAPPAGEVEQPQPLTAGISPGGWTWLGPGNIGGRTRALVVHPTTPTVMWAGSVGGGVWRTTSGGVTWAPLTDFMGSLAVSCLVLQPADPPHPPASTVLYAGTGEGYYNGDALRGAGLFKSTDGGVTWTQLSSTANPNFYWVNRLAFSADGKTLLAATRNGLFRSTNGGTTWTSLPAPVNREILDVRFHPTDNTRCVAAGRGGEAFYSTNGGTAWTQATGLPSVAGFGGRVELAYARANPNTLYASVDNNAGEVYVSADGGKTFALKNTGTNYLGGQGWYDNTIWAGDPTNVNLVVVGGLDLYRSTNGGTTFTQISQWWQAPASAHADHHTIVSHPGYNGISNKAVFFGNDGGIYRANDVTAVAGTSGWVVLNNNYGATQFYGAAGNPTSGRIVGGTQDNGTIRFTPPVGTGVNSWTTMFGGDGGFCAADPTDPNFFYGEYVYLQIHRSTNAGTSASYIYSGIGDAGSRANFIAPFILDPNNPNTLLAGGQQLWRSVNVKASTPFYTSIKQ